MTSHRTLPCEPFHVSNDHWSRPTAAEYIRRLRSLRADHNSSAALVIGAGTLPFTLDVLPPTIVVADLEKSVVNSVMDRCGFTANQGESWDDYCKAYDADGGVTTEFYNMSTAGLVRDFKPVKAAAKRARLIPLVGDIVAEAPGIVKNTHLRGKKFSLVYFTNVAQYLTIPGRLEKNKHKGRAVLAALLSRLPIHENAVICDSSFGQQATLFTPAQYTAHNAIQS